MMDEAALKERIQDEYADAELYRKMAEDCKEFDGIFCDIAAEEESHAKLLEHILEKLK